MSLIRGVEKSPVCRVPGTGGWGARQDAGQRIQTSCHKMSMFWKSDVRPHDNTEHDCVTDLQVAKRVIHNVLTPKSHGDHVTDVLANGMVAIILLDSWGSVSNQHVVHLKRTQCPRQSYLDRAGKRDAAPGPERSSSVPVSRATDSCPR